MMDVTGGTDGIVGNDDVLPVDGFDVPVTLT